jgi:pre-mRNA-splicing factor ATP-dependent RNA helicase DHX16
MEIKPAWLLEGERISTSPNRNMTLMMLVRSVAPHYFKPADLEQLAQGDKKMPKAIGASSSTAAPS